MNRPRRLWANPATKALTFAVVVALGALGAGALSRELASEPEREAVPEVLSLRPSQVERVVVQSADREVELERQPDGTWAGSAGVPPESETLMLTAEERLFPLPAYRQLATDASAPQFGLADPEMTVAVTGRDGNVRKVAIGASTFTKGVFAQRVGDDGTVYLVPRRMADDFRSVLAGQRIDAENELASKVRDMEREAGENARKQRVSWWLQQALEAGTPLPEGLE